MWGRIAGHAPGIHAWDDSFGRDAFLFSTAIAGQTADDRPRFWKSRSPRPAETRAGRDTSAARPHGYSRPSSQRHERWSAIGSFDRESRRFARSPSAADSLYVQVGRGGSDEALRRSAGTRPTILKPFHFAKLLKADGQSAKAITVLQKAVISKDIQDRPERLLFMLSDLYTLVDKKGDHAEAAKAQEAIIRTIGDKRDQLLYGNGLTREDLQGSLARAYERLGRARVQMKEYDKAAVAFREARNTLLKSDDPDSRHQAVRISWNLSEMAASQENWAEALKELDAYLEHGPAEIEPYEKKIEFLRKLERDRDVVPALRRYAAREESHLDLQLLLAKELSREPRMQREAEEIYLSLLRKNNKPEVYPDWSSSMPARTAWAFDEAVGKSAIDARSSRKNARQLREKREPCLASCEPIQRSSWLSFPSAAEVGSVTSTRSPFWPPSRAQT